MNAIRMTLTAVVLTTGAALLPSVSHAVDKACQLEIAGNDLMQFDKKELSVPASCKEVQLTLKHAGKLPKEAMGHNWVLVKTPDLGAVANSGMSAGLQNSYVAEGDKRVLAHTKVVGGGESVTITFSTAPLKAGEPYSYLCTFPGHNSVMRGTFKFG
ncbi:MAG TPA: azurin [Steroidobacteraceae bacterium]|nr:azurin [Steroidobacteraceae bacterium]